MFRDIFSDFQAHNKVDIFWQRFNIPKRVGKYAFTLAQEYYKTFTSLPCFFWLVKELVSMLCLVSTGACVPMVVWEKPCWAVEGSSV